MIPHRDEIISFCAGFLPSGVKTYMVLQSYTPLEGFIIKLAGSVLVGVFGGFAGILGKDIYRYTKRKIFSLFKKQ